MENQKTNEVEEKLKEAMGMDKPILIYNITNQESWAAATKAFFVQFFTFATIFAILAFFTDAAGCVDMVEVIHGR
jgi:hypothetical protein